MALVQDNQNNTLLYFLPSFSHNYTLSCLVSNTCTRIRGRHFIRVYTLFVMVKTIHRVRNTSEFHNPTLIAFTCCTAL